jgi:hypothetical protein
MSVIARPTLRSAPHWAAVIAASLGPVASVQAAGIEDTVGGAVALGRAANYVRVNDFMATWQNPANLAVIPGMDLGGELRLPILRACFDRARDPAQEYKEPDASTGFEGEETFGIVCNDAFPTPAGNLGWAQSFDTGWGYGLGFFTPAGVGSSNWGDDTIVTWPPYFENEVYPITKTGSQAPTRQMLVERRALAGFLMVGLGAQPITQLRLGLSGGVGFAHIRNKSVASVLGGTFRDQEIVNETTVSDWAIPRLVSSVVLSPLDSFDIMGMVTYSGDIEAEGHMDLTANGIQGAPLMRCTDVDPGPHCRIDGVKLNAPFHSLEVTLGLRYAKRRVLRERVLDPLRDEVWDVELDGFWAQTSKVDEFTLVVHDAVPGTPEAPRVDFTSDPSGSSSTPRPSVTLPKHWADTVGLRLGGDYNVLPGRLALRAGVSYMSRAVPRQFMNIDYWPVQKIGLHAGTTVAFERWRVAVAYSHLFYETIDVPVGYGQVPEVTSLEPQKAQTVNEGRYTAGVDIISIQGNLRF